MAERHAALGGSLLVDLGDELAQTAIGPAVGGLVGALDGLAEVGAFAGDGVDAGVDDYAEAVAALLDTASGTRFIRRNAHSPGAYSHPRPHPKINQLATC